MANHPEVEVYNDVVEQSRHLIETACRSGIERERRRIREAVAALPDPVGTLGLVDWERRRNAILAIVDGKA